MYAAGLTIYLRATRARDRIGRWGFFTLAAVLVVIYLAAAFGPPPPSIDALWVTALVGAVLLTAWAWWTDRHRDMEDAGALYEFLKTVPAAGERAPEEPTVKQGN